MPETSNVHTSADRADTTTTTPGRPVPVVMDVDTGVDDAMSLLFAVRSPQLDLRAVTCVGGNTNVAQVLKNTLYVLDVAGAPADLPVAVGAARPMLAEPEDASHVHGPDGLAGLSRASDRQPSDLSAIELLRKIFTDAATAGEKLVLVPSAPLTNIALLLRTYPEVAAGIEKILFMGGSASVGNATAAAEFNIWHDPEAAAVALQAAGELGIPVTMYGLDVFMDVVVGRPTAQSMMASTDPGTALAGALLDHQCEVFGSPATSIGDAGTTVALVDPAGLGLKRFPVQVVLGEGVSRGQTLVDQRKWAGDAARDRNPMRSTMVDVALTVEADRFAELWVTTVGGQVVR